MGFYRVTAALTFALALSPLAARAEDPIGSYLARIGAEDHFNSSGDRLKDAASILRQDRANFHNFRIRDRDDEPDTFFSTKEQRADMERLFERGGSDGSVRAIVDRNPLVEVLVYRNSIEVTVLD